MLLLFFNLTDIFCQSFSKRKEKQIVEELIVTGDSLKKNDPNQALSIFRKGLSISLDNKLNNQAAILYKKIGVLYHRQKDYKQAEVIYRNGINLDSTSTVAADLNYNISLLKAKFYEQDSVLFYLEKSLKLYENLELNNSAYKAFLRAGRIYKDRQLYEKALKYSIKAFEGFKKEGNNSKLADACTTIGNIQNQMDNYHQALEYHFQALELEQQLNNTFGKGISYTNIANVYDDLKISDSAISYYKKALLCFDRQSGQYAILINNLAITYKEVGNYKLAKNHFVESIKLNKFLRDTVSLLYNYNGVSSLFLDYDNLSDARFYLDSASTIISKVRDKKAILSFFENEAEYYKEMKRYKKALDFQIKYMNLYKDIYNTEQAKLVQNLQAKFEHQENENKILSLNLENKNSQLLLAEKTENIKNRNVIVIILCFVIVLMAVAYLLYIQRQKAGMQMAKIEKLEAIYEGQETIKKRIARDLHDIITTNFDGLRLRILALKRTSALNQNIDGITKDLKKMNQQIRMVSHRLYPLEMYVGKQKFTDIIKSRLSEFQLYGNVFVELENQFPEELNNRSLTVQNNFYGILLEVLNNIERHSHATKLIIKNYLDEENNIHFVFEDNGIGIQKKHKKGIGLMNIEQRVEILDGKSVITKTDLGTKVHINFPIT